MQVLEVHHDKRPSKTLEKLIDSCVSDFSKLNKSVNRVLEQGRKEGFSDIETGNLIRRKLIIAGFSDRTARRYLPASAKHMEKARARLGATSGSYSNNKSVAKLSADTRTGPNLDSKSAVILSAKTKATTTTIIQFEASITVNQDKRKIAIPAMYRNDVDRLFKGRKVKVTLE